MNPTEATGERRPATRRQRRVDLAIGVPVGLIVGIAILAAFLFLGSEGTIDAPRISEGDSGKPAKVRQVEGGPRAPGREAPR